MDKKILIIVDMQNGFARHEETKAVADKIVALTQKGFFDAVIATRFINREGSPYTEILNWHKLMGSPETDLVEGMKVDYVVDKYIYTCVNDGFLNLLSKINGGVLPGSVYICGVDTECCVLKIATDLFEQSVRPVVLLDYCASNGGEVGHNAGIEAMKRLIGTQCMDYGEIK